MSTSRTGVLLLLLFCLFITYPAPAQNSVTPDMVFNMSGLGHAWHLFDGNTATHFSPIHQHGFRTLPAKIVLRMKPQSSCAVQRIHFLPKNGVTGHIKVYSGQPGPNGWTLLNANKQYGNGVTSLEWFVNIPEAQYLKFEFSENPGFETSFGTGEISLTTSGNCSYTDAAYIASNRRAAHTFDEGMGVNHFVGKTNLAEFFGPFKNVREYLPWGMIQGHPGTGNDSPNGEDHPFNFAPCFHGYDLDRHYGNLNDMGKNVLGDLKESAPFQMYFDYETPNSPSGTASTLGLNFATMGGQYLNLVERKPGHPSGGMNPNNPDFAKPETYIEHAQALYQASLRYGKGGDAAKSRFADTQSKSNQGHFTWIENWNEQDKWWNATTGPAPIQPLKEQRLAYFTPEEYMAMTLADVSLADGALTLPLVMSGISELDEPYLRGMWMAWYDLTGTDPAQTFPFQALTFHHYSLNSSWTHCEMPEADAYWDGANPQSPLSRILAFSDTYLPGREIWLTEFGYSSHPNDNTAARPNYAGADMEEIQAQWLMRAFLRLNRYGVDRSFAYQLTDDGPNQWHGMFNHTGMVDRIDPGSGLPEYRLKKSWFYLYTLRQALAGAHFLSETSYHATDARPVSAYTFLGESGDKRHVLWIPQANSPSLTQTWVAVSPGANCTLIRPQAGSIAGDTMRLADSDGDGLLLVDFIGETPIFLLESTEAVQNIAECNCHIPLAIMGDPTSAAKRVVDESQMVLTPNGHPRCAYGANAYTRWEGPTGTATFDMGNPGMSDQWLVEGIYLHDPAGQEGTVILELLDENSVVLHTIQAYMDGNAVFPFTNYGVQHVWKRFEGIGVAHVTALRVSKSNGAALGEISVCATPSEQCLPSTQLPSPLSQASVQVGQSSVDFSWSLPNHGAEVTNLDLSIYEPNGTLRGRYTLTTDSIWSASLQLFDCGVEYAAEIVTHDCRGLTSPAFSLVFKTPDCPSSPTPTDTTATACACVPRPISVQPNYIWYELRPQQLLPNPAISLFDACADAAPDKSPFRLVDEQNVASISAICASQGGTAPSEPDYWNCADADTEGFPHQEWFPSWETATYPYHAVLRFNGTETFNGLYLYDSNGEGEISIAYRDSYDGNWETLPLGPSKSKYLRTDQWRKWRRVAFTEYPIQAKELRVTMYSPEARISEIMLCGSAHPTKNVVQVQKNDAKTKNKKAITSVSAPAVAFNVQVYPNPAREWLHIQSTERAFTQVVFFDAIGRKVFESPQEVNRFSEKITLETVLPGVYYMKISDKNGFLTVQKIVIR